MLSGDDDEGGAVVEITSGAGGVDAADWALFGKNGGDATTLAVMVARAATGREKIVKIDDGYHGVTAWMQVARLAAAHNLPVTSHGVHDLHVHLLAAVPNASFVEVHGFGLEPFLREPLTVCDGVMLAPDRPGHGVELDWPALEPHRA